MPHPWCKIIAAASMILFAASGIQAAENQIEKKVQATEAQQQKTTTAKNADRQQVLDSEHKSWSNIKALWG